MEQLILEKFSSQEIIDFALHQLKNIMDSCGDIFHIAAMVLIVCIVILIISLSYNKFNYWLVVTSPEFVIIGYAIIFMVSIAMSLFSGVFYYSAEYDYNKILNSPEPIAVTTALKYWES